MNIEPLGHRVLVKPDIEDSTTDWGFEMGGNLFNAEQGATQTGTIVAIGPSAWLDFKPGTPWAAVGDRIYFAKYAHKVVYDGEEIPANLYFVINDEDVQVRIGQEDENFIEE